MKNKKKRISYIVLFTVMLICMSAAYKSNAYAAGANLTGNQVVRAGDNIIVNLYISAPGSYGIEGNLSYDSNVVSLNKIQSALNGWKVETNGNKVIAYDDALTNPLGGSQAVITASFKVKDVAAGTEIKIAFNNIVTSDGTSESGAGNAVYSVKISQPLSGDNSLKAMSVEGFNINFSENTMSYDLGEVEFSISGLKINAVARDNKASVTVGNTTLSVGKNTIYVNVKAENGAVKTYTVNVVRKQDPDYVPGKNANLSKITVSAGTLSPEFSWDITEYVVYLPYEARKISIEAEAEDAKAKQVINAESDSLSPGENKLVVAGVAEDGTKKEYTIKVMVMPEYNGVLPEINSKIQEDESTEEVTENETTAAETKEASENNSDGGKVTKSGIPVYAVIIIVVLAAAAGFGASTYINGRKKV